MSKIKLVVLDLDGTLCLGNELISDSLGVVSVLQRYYKTVFFSNISGKTSDVFGKLCSFGFLVNLHEVYTSGSETVNYLKDNNLDNIYVIGSNSFKDEVYSSGIHMCQNELANHVVVGLDFSFNYHTIETAVNILLRGGKFIACNEDKLFPVGDNRVRPGNSVIVGAIESVIGKKADFVVGKPNTYILKKISDDFKVHPNEMVVIGDSEESDIAMCSVFGCDGILVGQTLNHFDPVRNYFKEIF